MIVSNQNVTDSEVTYAVQMIDIVKKFPGVLANDHVNIDIRKGEIHALLGENGAGKTTLMNILYGLYGPDGGNIVINDRKVMVRDPIDAMNNGIGMVHQHFMLVPIMSVAENVALGAEPSFNGIRLNMAEMRQKVNDISSEYGMEIDPDIKIENLPVGLQQRVEILKILYRKAEILILDEPTAVLTPQEVTELFKTLEFLRQEGKTIVIITHKLKEPMALADRITVLRGGRMIGTVNRENTSAEELAEMMIGRKLMKIEKHPPKQGKILLEIQDLHVEGERGKMAVRGVNLDVKSGEIVGIAGVVGNGQSELAEAITGLKVIQKGSVRLLDKDITGYNPRKIYDIGLSYIPEDRRKDGSIGDFTVAENLILALHHHRKWYRAGILRFFMNWRRINDEATDKVKRFDIRTPSVLTRLKSLSGGNQQKVIVARELSKNPSVILAAQPTRGLDVGVIEYVHSRLLELRNDGKGVLLVSSDLDEILAMSDRIVVMYEGEIVAHENPQDTDERRLGLLMAGHSI
ncbi:MAG: ABC transporter ATP-binding protein [Candidatus Hodarchaeales archaeon]